jgi:hypothetical protein
MKTKLMLFSWLKIIFVSIACIMLMAASFGQVDNSQNKAETRIGKADIGLSGANVRLSDADVKHSKAEANVRLSGAEAPPVKNTTCQQGEYLKFRLHYGFITAGHAALEVKPGLIEKNGRQCLHVVGTGWSTPTFDHVFRIRDKYETFIDTHSLTTVHFNCKIEEGKFKHYHEVLFDQEEHTATRLEPNRPASTYSVPEGIQDVLSAFFYARATNNQRELEPGDRISLRNYHDRKTFGLWATMVKRERIKVEGEKYNAIKFKLNVKESGMITDGGKITFWISDDENKIPLRIKADLLVGSLKIDLEEAKGLRNAMTSMIKK